MPDPILIIGAGLSGLAAALEIEAAGESSVIFDEAAHVGGKLETTVIEDSYRLDRGFQVLLPAYPEFQRIPNLASELSLRYFNSGARLEMTSGPVLMADPLRHPQYLISTALGKYATLRDKLLVLKLQNDLRVKDPAELLAHGEGSTLDYLKQFGFSDTIIHAFWQPFYSGIFLESDLATSAGFFRYLTAMFASSPVAVPQLGIGELPKLLASKLTKTEIRLSARIDSIEGKTVKLTNGKKITGSAVLNTTSGHTKPEDPGPFGRVTSFWFKAPEAPFEGAWLSLNSREPAAGRKLNHVAVLSNVSPDYAVKGDALICASCVGRQADSDLPVVLREAETLYGASVREWSLLRTDHITKPFPLYLNRTDLDTPSQQGALSRGRRAAQLALAQL